MELAVRDSHAQLASANANASAPGGGPAVPVASSATSTPTPTPGAGTGTVVAAEPGAPASDAGGEVPVNPRKRKKASRACDFCHVNHQPCDNAQPKCGVCQKHNKPCLYLRPTKRRGPQKGYRTALNSYKESAAAWGAVLSAIPGLDALIEGHLLGSGGSSITAAIKDGNQQDALINKWQQSTVFKAIFGHNNHVGGSTEGENGAPSQADANEDEYASGADSGLARLAPAGQSAHSSASQKERPSPRSDQKTPVKSDGSYHQRDVVTSLSDIVAKDAAQSSSRASRTLASLGFAPNETIADFNTMGSNPEPIAGPNDQDFFDPALGTESEQRAYYELLMGRAFPA